MVEGSHTARRKAVENQRRSAPVSTGRLGKHTGISKQQVSRWAKSLKDRAAYRARLYGAAWKKAMGEAHNHRAQGTGENEW